VAPSSVFSGVASFAFVGGLALGMALFRELYPGWRGGIVQGIYDLLLIAITLFFALGVIFDLTVIKPL
jgi:hypothetical protein